jgi:chromosome partitioning protein
MPVIAMLNQKGGVGKTSTCHHLAGTLAGQGRRILLVDADPQASLTQGFWGPPATGRIPVGETIAAIYSGEEPFAEQVIKPTGVENIDLLPGSAHANDHNGQRPGEADPDALRSLRTFLEDVRERYDLVLIDCTPTLLFCSWTAMIACDHLIVPLQAEDYGAQGILAIQRAIGQVQAGYNPDLRLLGYLITMFNGRLAIHKAYEQMLRATYGADVFATMVPYAADFKEAIAQRQPIAQYKPRGNSAKSMKALADELLTRLDERGASDAKGAA